MTSLSHEQAEVLAEIAERRAGTEPYVLFTGHRRRTARTLLDAGLVTECPRGPYWFTLSAAGAEAYDALPAGRYRNYHEWLTVRAAMSQATTAAGEARAELGQSASASPAKPADADGW